MIQNAVLAEQKCFYLCYIIWIYRGDININSQSIKWTAKDRNRSKRQKSKIQLETF